MCGICGGLTFDGTRIEQSVIEAMTDSIRHRGPDGEGAYADGPVAFGHRRLAIIDPAAGAQPLTNQDGSVCITYNGEIYNFPELMTQLIQRGHHFRTHCDTEVVVHAYEEWGIDCLDRLNGMYAFGLWDARKRQLLLARDPYGIKPLYVWQTAGRLMFASEVKAFLQDPRFEPTIDPVALDHYLTYQFVPSPRTLLAQVEKLPPGHAMVVGPDGSVAVHVFGRRLPHAMGAMSEGEAIDELQRLMVAAVRRQLISDVPLGVLLSGGVDSGTVAALMAEASSQPIKTFTVGFEGTFARNELVQARRTADMLGSEHHDVTIGATDCMKALDEMIWHLDEPIANSSALAMLFVSRLAAQHVKVVLTGQGADEPWAGYRRYRGELLGSWYRRVPGVLRRHIIMPGLARLPRLETVKRAAYALQEPDPVRRFTNVYTGFTPAMKRRLYRSESTAVDDTAPLRYWQGPVSKLPPLAQQLYVETRFSLPDNLLLYGDKMSMAWSLEARVPWLDLELMDFVEGLPTHLRLRGWSGHKYLYRKAIRRWLPAEVLERPKIGFATPMDQWLQDEIRDDIRERIVGSGSACSQFFNTAYVDQLIEEHARRQEDHTRVLLTLLIFELWHATFMRSASRSRSRVSPPPIVTSTPPPVAVAPGS